MRLPLHMRRGLITSTTIEIIPPTFHKQLTTVSVLWFHIMSVYLNICMHGNDLFRIAAFLGLSLGIEHSDGTQPQDLNRPFKRTFCAY